MDVIKASQKIKDLNDYITFTNDLLKNRDLSRQLNLNTVSTFVNALNKIHLIEVQYFDKCNKCGAAVMIFEWLLVKGMAGPKKLNFQKQLILVMEYWLTRVRMYLIYKNVHWWNFLRTLLNFVQKLYMSLDNQLVFRYLVEHTGKCLLELATQKETSSEQRCQILKYFNLTCSTLPRLVRDSLRHEFDKYFTELAAWLPRCGAVFVQFTVMETLLRWLVPQRNKPALRAAAARWFPDALYPRAAVRLFVERSWITFNEDARVFLNAVNEGNDTLMSVQLEKLSVAHNTLISSNSSYQHWLDLNTEVRSVSVIMNAMMYKTLQVDRRTAPVVAALVITVDNTASAQMYSAPDETVIVFKVIDPLKVFPAQSLHNKNDFTMTLCSMYNVHRLEQALKKIFDKKYQRLQDTVNLQRQQSTISHILFATSEEDTRFSVPPEVPLRKRLEQRAPSGQSQSPASTPSSPKENSKDNIFGKRVEKVCVKPIRPIVSEKTSPAFLRKPNPDSTNSIERKSKADSQSTEQGKNENANNDISNKNQEITNLLAQEALQHSRVNASGNIHDNCSVVLDKIDKTYFANINTKKRDQRQRTFKVISDSTATDDLNTAFVENTPAININTNGKKNNDISNKNQNIINLLAQEALQHSRVNASGNTHDNCSVVIDKIDKTYFANINTKNRRDQRQRNFKVISDSTATDDSNTAFVENTPAININTNGKKPTATCKENQFDKNGHGDIVVSPSLAKRLNDPNSGSPSASLTLYSHESETEHNFKYMEVVECINFIVNKVSENVDTDIECVSTNLNPNNTVDIGETEAGPRKTHLQKPTNMKEKVNKVSASKEKPKSKPKVKITFKNTKNQPRAIKNKPDFEDKKSSIDDEIETPLNKRKRKLYSTKDADSINAKTGIHISDTKKDSFLTGPVKKAPIPASTPYKEIEKIRKNAAARKQREQKSKVVSPKIQHLNNVFDLLKKTDNHDKVVLVDRDAVYNFTSSDDDCRTEIGTAKPKAVSKDLRRQNKPKSDTKHKLNSNEKRVRRKVPALADERMRAAATDVFNTSIVIESREDESNVELVPSHKKPKLEVVPGDREYEIVTAPVTEENKQIKNTKKRAKKPKNVTRNKLVTTKDKADDDDAKTISPLPVLEIETAQRPENVELDDSIVNLDELDNERLRESVLSDLPQRVPSESEQVDHNPPRLNIADERNELVDKDTSKHLEKRNKNNTATETRSARSSSYGVPVTKQLVVVLERTDIHSSTSISTVGRCPIRAHGETDELPPRVDEIARPIPRRSLETEEYSPDVVEFYDKITRATDAPEVRDSPHCNNDLEASSNSSKTAKSVAVSVTRLSRKEIDSYLVPPRKPLFDSSLSTSKVTKRKAKTRLNDKITQGVRKSIISPIVFDDDEERRSSEAKPTERTKATSDESPSDSIRYELRKYGKAPSSKDKSGSSKGSDDRGDASVAKRQRVHSESTPASVHHENQPSCSSVEEWLSKNQAPTGRDKVSDVLAGVLEMIDKTLNEMQLISRDSLRNMLVEMRGELERVQARRKQQLREVAKEVLDSLSRMNHKFKEQDKTFIEKFEKRTSAIIGEKYKKQRDMMTLLKEEIQAVMRLPGDDGHDK